MKKKILIITPKFFPSIGGIEEQVKLLGINFLAKGYKVYILTNNFNNLRNKENINGLNIIRFNGYISYIFYLLKYKNVDLILSRQYYKNSFILGIFKFLKIIKAKTVIIGDGGTKLNEIEIIRKKILFLSLYKVYFFIIGNNDFLIGNNKHIIKSLKIFFDNKKVFKIYNSINLENFIHKKISKIENILFLSRFDEGKGYIETIEAFQKIKNKKIKLHIIGYGKKNIENNIKKLIEKDNRIIFHGKKYGKNKENIIKNCDLFVFPTYYIGESFGMVLYEMALYNIPIISTRFGDTKEIFGNNILYVKENNIIDLKEKIEYIIKNVVNFEYNYIEILKKIDINKVTEQFIKLK